MFEGLFKVLYFTTTRGLEIQINVDWNMASDILLSLVDVNK
jgi:hypothetical protein